MPRDDDTQDETAEVASNAVPPENAPPGMPLKRTLARNTSANAVAQLASVASAFVLMPFLLRSFGLETYGVYVFASSLSGYVAFLDFGVGLSLTKLLAEYRGRGDDDAVGTLVSSALAFYLGVGFLASAVLMLVSRYVIGWFHFGPAEQELARQLLLVGAILSPVSWPVLSVTAVQAGLHRYDLNAKATLAAVVLNAAATVAVIVFRLGPVVLAAALTIDMLVVSAWNWRKALAGLGTGVRLHADRVRLATLRPIIKLSAYIFVIQLSTVLIYQQTDRLIVGFFVGAAAVTIYEGAGKLESAVRQAAALMASAVVPATSHLAATENEEGLRRLLLRGTRYCAFFVLPMALGLILLARPLLVTWLGPELAPAVLPAQVFLSYWLVNVNAIVLGSMIVGIGRLDRVIWWQNLATVMNVVLGVVLTWRFGLMGVILGTVLSHLFILPVYTRVGYGLFGVSFRQWFSEVAAAAYPPLVLVALIAAAGYFAGLERTLAGVAVTGLVSVAAYWLAVYGFVLKAEEKRDVHALARAVATRLGARRHAG